MKTHPPVVLIIDDSPENVEVLAGILSDDYDIRFALSGSESLALVEGMLPDLILLDVMMPGMDGYQVLEALKQEARTRDVPVIFVTAKDDAISETRALCAGAVDFIHKPINPEVVRARVHLHLELEHRAVALRQANNEIALHRDHLDELVYQRTLELAAALDEAQCANRAKTTFLANISHEMRTPMHHILGYTHLLARNLTDSKARERLDRIGQATEHLLSLISDVIDTARLEADQMRIEALELDLSRVFQHAVEQARAGAGARVLQLSSDIDPHLPTHLVGDPVRLSQVIGNLLNNAVKFSHQGLIIVRAQRVDTHSGSVTVRFAVEDQGPGIDQALRERLFNLFEQKDSSLTREYDGLGLGLALSQRLVSLMGGEIGVESAPGQGSCFWFKVRLPVCAAGTGAADDDRVDWSRIEQLAVYLMSLLAEGDMRAQALWRDSRRVLEPLLGGKAAVLAQHLEAFEFSQAVDLLREAVSTCPDFN